VPTDRVEVENVAVPEVRSDCPIWVPPSRIETVPVGTAVGGVVPGQAAGATITVMVTVWPELDGLGALLRVTVVDAVTI
jgi:hypothetical protein